MVTPSGHKTRKIGGDTFSYFHRKEKKADAEDLAEDLRHRGLKVRLLKDPRGGWGVYTRGGRKRR